MILQGHLRTPRFNAFMAVMIENPPPVLKRAESVNDLVYGLCRPREAYHLPAEFALCVNPQEELVQVENHYLIIKDRHWVTVNKKTGEFRAGGDSNMIQHAMEQYFDSVLLSCIE